MSRFSEGCLHSVGVNVLEVLKLRGACQISHAASVRFYVLFQIPNQAEYPITIVGARQGWILSYTGTLSETSNRCTYSIRANVAELAANNTGIGGILLHKVPGVCRHCPNRIEISAEQVKSNFISRSALPFKFPSRSKSSLPLYSTVKNLSFIDQFSPRRIRSHHGHSSL